MCPIIQTLYIHCSSQSFSAPPRSILELPQYLHFSLLVNPNRLIGDLLKMEQTDTEATVTSASKKLTQFLTLSCLNVSVFEARTPWEQKDLLQLKPWKTTSNILITICSTKKKSSYKKFGITPQLNNLNFLLHLEYYTPTALNEWNFRTAMTACLSFKALRQLNSSF